MSVYITCQFCGKRIDLKQRKDFESYSGKEWSQHIHEEHYEQVQTRGGITLIPYGMEREDEPDAQHA